MPPPMLGSCLSEVKKVTKLIIKLLKNKKYVPFFFLSVISGINYVEIKHKTVLMKNTRTTATRTILATTKKVYLRIT